MEISTLLSVIEKISKRKMNKNIEDLATNLTSFIFIQHTTKQQQNTHNFQEHIEHSPR